MNNNTNSYSITALSIHDRKKMRNKIVFSMYLFLFFILLPIALLQEFFIILYITPLAIDNPIFWDTLWIYAKEHYIVHTYIILIIVGNTGMYLYLKPYLHYIMTGANVGEIRQKMINPIGLFAYFLIIPNICNLVNLVLDFQYITTMPINTLVHFFTFKIIWQILSCMLTIYFFFHITTSLKKTLSLYSFPPQHKNIYANIKEILIAILQLSLFLIVILEMFFLLDRVPVNTLSSEYLNQVLNWGGYTIILCIIFSSTLLIWQQYINNSIKKNIHQDVENLVEQGNLNTKNTYYEQNILGSFFSEYNRFTDYLNTTLTKIHIATKTLHAENNNLRNNTSELTSALNEQEINVSQMNIATNRTSTNIQYLLAEVDKQLKILNQEQENMQHLTTGTVNIIDTFNLITKEHLVSQQSNDEALVAVHKSLEKSELMNTHIINIHNKIKIAGIETLAINEVLNAIKNISEQTNLLSMSAAIEAAHGDTSRKGFTLVAEEIRKLAQMSQESVSKIAIRLSTITDHINSAYQVSKESLELSESSLRTGTHLKKSIALITEISKELSEITKQTAPITSEQYELIHKFQNVITSIYEFLQYLVKELKNESTTSVLMSLNFRTMIQNFKKSRSSLYHIETGFENLLMVEKHLEYILQEFIFEQHTEEYKNINE